MKHREPEAHAPLASKRRGDHASIVATQRAWAARLTGRADATIDDLTTDARAFVDHELRKLLPGFQAHEYDRQMIATQPVIAAPANDRPIGDLHLMLDQPEFQDMWHGWHGPPPPPSGPRPNYAGAKMVAVVMALTSHMHACDAIDVLEQSPELRRRFEQLEGRPIAIPTGPTFCRLLPRRATSGLQHIRGANVHIIVAIDKLQPALRKRRDRVYLIDGTAIPAWVRQIGKPKVPGGKLELKLKKQAPDAAFRMYEHTANGKKEAVGPLDGKAAPARIMRIKGWRGFL